jgi:ABC-2 type transport system permease protein
MHSLRRLTAVAKKETREILRDPITLGIAIFLPLLMMFLFSYAITLDVKKIALAVVDEDNSAESRDFVASLIHSGYFRLHAVLHDIHAVAPLLDRGAIRVALHIPADFSRHLNQGLSTEVQTLIDGSFSNTAIIIRNYVDAITQTYTHRLQERALASHSHLPTRSSAIQIASRVRFNPALRSEYYVIPGLFPVILMAFPPC